MLLVHMHKPCWGFSGPMKQTTENKLYRLRMPTGRRQTSWLYTRYKYSWGVEPNPDGGKRRTELGISKFQTQCLYHLAMLPFQLCFPYLIFNYINVVISAWSLFRLLLEVISQGSHVEIVAHTITTAQLSFAKYRDTNSDIMTPSLVTQ